MTSTISGKSLGLELTSAYVLGGSGAVGQIGSAAMGRLGTNVYVNASTGNLVIQNRDEMLIGRGPDVAIDRTYNSQGLFTDENGDNWQQSTQRTVLMTVGSPGVWGNVVRTNWDGSQALYQWDGARGGYVSSNANGAVDVIKFAANKWTWIDGNTHVEEQYDYLAGGRLLSTKDLDGNAVDYTYTGNLLTKVKTASLESTEFTYYAGTNNIEFVRTLDSSGTVVQTRTRYTYDSQNRLSSVTVDLTPSANWDISDNNAVTTSYSYVDSTSKLISSISETGNSGFVSFEYDSNNRIIKVTQVTPDKAPQTTNYTYSSSSLTSVTGPLGNETKFAFDASTGQLTKLTYAQSAAGESENSWQYGYHWLGAMGTRRKADGSVDLLNYDANGNLTSLTDAALRATNYTYGSSNEVLTETHWTGYDEDTGWGPNPPTGPMTTRYVYDATSNGTANHLRFMISPEGEVTEYRYNGYGQLISTLLYTTKTYTDTNFALGDLNTWLSTQLTAADLAATQRTDTAYDFRGNVSTVTTFTSITSSGAGDYGQIYTRVTFVYDQSGMLRSKQASDVYGTPLELFAYDGLNRLISTTDVHGKQTTYTYTDSLRRLTATTWGGRSTITYYGGQNEVSVTIEGGTDIDTVLTQYRYDELGRLKSTQQKINYSDAAPFGDYIFYDGAGRKVGYVDARGYLTEYKWSPANQMLSSVEYNTKLSSATLAGLFGTSTPNSVNLNDPGIRPASTSSDRWTFFIYDRADKLIQQINNDGTTTAYTYDGAGRLTQTREFVKTLSGWVSSFRTSPPNVETKWYPTSDANDRITRDFYDKSDRLIGVLDASGAFTQFVYDKAGRKVDTIAYANLVSSGLRASGTFDAIAADVVATPNSLDRHTNLVYDNRGNVRYMIDGTGRVTQYFYDAVGRAIRTTQYGGVITTASSYTSSGVANQISSLNLANHADTRVTRNVYTVNDRLAYTIDPMGYVTRFVYDPSGNVIKQIQYANAFPLSSDPAITTIDGWASTISANDHVTFRYFDSLNRLTLEAVEVDFIAPSTSRFYVTSYKYNLLDKVTETVNFGGKYAVTDSDTASSILTNIGVINPSTDRRTVYFYDSQGRVIQEYTYNGLTIKNYIYNAFGQLSDIVDEPINGSSELYATGVDAVWYASQHAGVAVEDAIAHYDQVGWQLGYDPNPLFSTSYYVANNSSVLNGLNPLEHFLLYGWQQNRAPNSSANAIENYRDKYSRTTTHYEYDTLGRLASETTAYNAPEAAVTTYAYNSFGEVSVQTDARGNATIRNYDLMGRLKEELVPLSGSTSAQTLLSYDAFGNVVQKIDPRSASTYYYYDKLNRLVLQIDPEGYATETSYNRADRLIATKRYYDKLTGPFQPSVKPTPLAHAGFDATTTIALDKLDRVIMVTDAMQKYEQYTLNAFGDRVVVRNKLGGLTYNTFDMAGRLIKEELPVGSSRLKADGSAQAGNVKNEYQYDARGNLIAKIEASGFVEQRTTTYDYNMNNLLVKKQGDAVPVLASDGVTTTMVTPIERYSYDGRENLIRVENAAGKRTYYFYDHNNRKVGEVNAVGTLSTWTYDANGNVINTRVYPEPISLTELSGIQNLERAFGSDRPGALHLTDTEYRETRFEYDKNNRLTKTVVPNVRVGFYDTTLAQPKYVTILGYDVTVAENTYDAMGNIVAVKDGSGGQILSWYDGNGRKIVQVDQENFLTTWTYDDEGNVKQERRYANKLTSISPTPANTAAQVIAAGVTGNSDRVTEFEYDLNGNRTKLMRKSIEEVATTSTYLLISGGAQDSIIEYTYNDAGQIQSKKEANLDLYEYGYDAAGRLKSTKKPIFVDSSGTNVREYLQYVYDGLQNVIEIMDWGIRTSDGQIKDGLARSTRYVYGAGGRLEKTLESYGKNHDYFYDVMGNMVKDQYVRALGDWTTETDAVFRSYDAMGRQLTQANTVWNAATSQWVGSQTSNTRYNAFGEVEAKGINNMWQETFDYNRRGQLRRTNTSDGAYRLYIYDKNGNVSLKMESYAGSAAGITASDLTSISFETALNVLTNNGAEAIGQNVRGITPTMYVYDKRNQLVRTIEPSREVDFNNPGGDPSGIGTRITDTINNWKTYNAFGEVSSETNARNYTTTYEYNDLGKMTRRTLPGVSVLGENGASTGASPIEKYYYDISGRLVGTIDANNNVSARTLLAGTGHGDDEALVVNELFLDGSTQRKYDAFGRMVSFTNEVALTDTYSYDVLDRVMSVAHAGGNTDDYEYDILGQRIRHGTRSVTGGAYIRELTIFDVDGRITKQTDFANRSTVFSYNWNAGLQTLGLGAYGAWVKTTISTANKTSSENIDYFGRSIGRVNMAGMVVTSSFNKAGLLLSEDRAGVVGTVDDATNFYQYYNTGRLLSTYADMRVEVIGTSRSAPTTILGRYVETQYGYDLAGNRTRERSYTTLDAYDYDALQNHGLGGNGNPRKIKTQDATISYDSLNRMSLYSDKGEYSDSGLSPNKEVSITYSYDANGNVRRTNAIYYDISSSTPNQQKEYWYTYDVRNRVIISGGKFVGAAGSGSIDIVNSGVKLTYDAAGRRIYSLSASTQIDPYSYIPYTVYKREKYNYNSDDYIMSVSIASGSSEASLSADSTISVYERDLLGRVTSYEEKSGATTTYKRYNITYDNVGLILSETVLSQGVTYNTTYDYNLNAAAGGLLINGSSRQNYAGWGAFAGVLTHSLTMKGSNKFSETEYLYHWQDGAQKYYSRTLKGTQTSYTEQYEDSNYDSWGHLATVTFDIGKSSYGRTNFLNTFDGKVLGRWHSKGTAPSQFAKDFRYFANEIQVGAIGNDGAPDSDYASSVDNRYVQPTDNPFRSSGGASSYADFDMSLERVTPTSQDDTPSSYSVQTGDTLSSIALALWGDASLWYILAEANGLSASSTLVENTLLRIPSRVSSVHNTASTFKPYDPNQAINNSEPTLPTPRKPPKSNKCGILGQVLLIAVAVVVAYYAAPALVAGAGSAGLGTAGANIVGGALAAAAGSVASQGVGLATGLQDKFSFKGVAVAAVAGGVGGALGRGGIFGAKGAFGGIQDTFAAGALKSAANNVVTQGILTVTGLQSRFDFTGVAVAAAAGGASALFAKQILQVNDLSRLSVAQSASTGIAGALAGAASRSLLNGSDFGDNILATLPDVLGNTIGNLAAQKIASLGAPQAAASADPLNGTNASIPTNAEKLLADALPAAKAQILSASANEAIGSDAQAKLGKLAGVLDMKNVSVDIVSTADVDGAGGDAKFENDRGVIRIAQSPGLFGADGSVNVGFLAAVLVHEASHIYDQMHGLRPLDLKSIRMTERNAYGDQADFLKASGITMVYAVNRVTTPLTRSTYRNIAENSVVRDIRSLQKSVGDYNSQVNRINRDISARNGPTLDYNNQVRKAGHPELAKPLPYKPLPRRPVPAYSLPGDL